MRVKLTKMRYVQGQGRKYAGEVIEWPHAKLGAGMVEVDKPVAKPVVVEAPRPAVALSEVPVEVPVAPAPEALAEPVPQRRPRRTQSDQQVL
mgnify:CR=1 FL=1